MAMLEVALLLVCVCVCVMAMLEVALLGYLVGVFVSGGSDLNTYHACIIHMHQSSYIYISRV